VFIPRIAGARGTHRRIDSKQRKIKNNKTRLKVIKTRKRDGGDLKTKTMPLPTRQQIHTQRFSREAGHHRRGGRLSRTELII
jgi:hypothetical protein